MKSLAVVAAFDAASPITVAPADSACVACSAMPVATRFTRATGDCLRDDERLVDDRLLDELPLEPRFDALFDPLFDAPFEPRFDVLLRELLLLLELLLLELLLPRDELPLDFRPLDLRPLDLRPVDFRPVDLLAPDLRPLDLRPLDLRDADFVDGDLREEEDFRDDDFRDDEPPVREPALRLELLRDDFFAAMLDSETRVGWTTYVIPSKNRAQMYGPQDQCRVPRYLLARLDQTGETMRMTIERLARGVLRRTVLRGMVVRCALTACAVTLGACRKGDTSTSGAPVAGKISASAAAPDTDIAAHGAANSTANSTANAAANGAALPPGYVAQLDRANASASDVAYTQKEPGRWEVRTGPAHILYTPADTAAGKYTASATFEQVEAPAHPEAYGIFIGGSALNDPATRKYTYFIVRGDGKYAVKARNGADVRTITDWTASSAVPRQDAAGKALYGIKVESDGKTARVSVNGAPVTTITPRDGPISGIVGVRVNHNLHLIITPASIIR